MKGSPERPTIPEPDGHGAPTLPAVSTAFKPAHVDDIITIVRNHACVIPHGNLTKQPLVAEAPDSIRLDLSALTGVTGYDPTEFTFSALAGTPLKEIEALLAANGQHMPFDPPLVDEGATIGGTVAAGMSGPGRLRYGGVRDFIIGIGFVDGTASHVHGGGRVVKNAAGFDLPRLLVGSMGRLGIITDVTFKVFPAPAAWRSLRITCRDLDDALVCTAELSRAPLDLDALELEPPATLVIRVAGDEASLVAHAERVGQFTRRPFEQLGREDESHYWRVLRSFTWLPPDHWLIKVPLTLRRIADLERAIQPHALPRRYSVAGNVAWLAWPAARPLDDLDLGASTGLVVYGPHLRGASPLIGQPMDRAEPFARRVKDALDPRQRLPALI